MTIYGFLIAPLLLSGLVHHLVVVKYGVWPSLARPIDGGAMWRDKPLLGSSKTWRGVAVMIGLNGMFSALAGKILSVGGLGLEPMWVGVVTAVGYSLGELPTSFGKRRLDIPPSQQAGGWKGAVFYGWEQADSIIGAVVAANLVMPLTLIQSGILIIMGTGLHWLVDCGLYLFGYKKNLAKPEVLKKLLGRKGWPEPE